MNDVEKSKKSVRELIMKTHHPEQWVEEQAEKKKNFDELMSFVNGVLAGLDQAKQAQELAKGKPVFVTDANDPKSFRPNH